MARVLIVDDTDIVRKALEKAVRRMGHSAVSTSDSVEALAIAVKDPPDLALVDYRMPRMDGATLFEELRASLGDRCPKVLFVSASPPELVARSVEPIGRPAGYVKKPFHLDDLMRVVDEALRAA
ncbi:MAG TPA: response regulator [Anaeromyxobacter sp.]|nr:response regulator [Anaeromyxobacter sp.]